LFICAKHLLVEAIAAMFDGRGVQLTGAFAEFERTMIRQRIKAGLKRAVALGVKLGRPKIDSATERKVRKRLRRVWVS
jgi:DNA invertase Pin-like site-specific DNA recombinase